MYNISRACTTSAEHLHVQHQHSTAGIVLTVGSSRLNGLSCLPVVSNACAAAGWANGCAVSNHRSSRVSVLQGFQHWPNASSSSLPLLDSNELITAQQVVQSDCQKVWHALCL